MVYNRPASLMNVIFPHTEEELVDDPIPLQAAAQLFGIKVDRLRKAAGEGRLEVRWVGSQRLVLPSEVERFLAVNGRAPAQKEVPVVGKGDGTARVIAVAVPKGGTGKTTTVLNLGAALAEQGQHVLLVDFDPQASLTLSLGYKDNPPEQTIYSAMKYFLATYESQIDQAILPTAAGFDLVPSSVRLNLANEELTATPQRELVLKKLLAPVVSRYDTILIDTLPYLGILVVNALVAAQEVIIPVQATFLATESVTLMLQQIHSMRRSGLNPDLQVCGILLTQVKPRTLLNRQFVDLTRQEFGTHVPVFDTVITETNQFAESQAMEQTILQYAPKRGGAIAYRTLAEEVRNGAR